MGSSSIFNQDIQNVVADFNSNGKSEVLIFTENEGRIDFKLIEYDPTNSPIPFIESGNDYYAYATPNNDGEELPFITVGEVNGDGKPDLIFCNLNPIKEDDVVTSRHEIAYYLNIGSGWDLEWTEIMLNSNKILKFHVMDMNGDGLSDIISMRGQTQKVSFCQSIDPSEVGEQSYYLDPDVVLSDLSSDYEIMAMGNFNGDNLLDLIVRKDEQYLWVYYNSGIDFATANTGIECDVDNDEKEVDRIIVSDFNNDGLSDFIKANEVYIGLFNNTYEKTNWRYYTNNGVSFIRDSEKDRSTTVRAYEFTVADIYGTGMLDEITHNSGSNLFNVKKNYTENLESHKLLSKIITGDGIETDIFYNRMLDLELITSYTYDAIQPIENDGSKMVYLKSPLIHLVSQTTNGLTSLKYKYHNGLTSFKKGFLGIEKYTIENLITETKTETQTILELDHYTPSIVNTKTYYSNELLTEIQQEFSTNIILDNRYYITQTTSWQHDLLKDSKVVNDFSSFNSFGMPEKSISNYYTNNGSNIEATRIVNIEYENREGSPYQIGLIKKKTTLEVMGSDTITNIQDFDYDPVYGSLSRRFKHKGTDFELKNEYEYDDFGNIESSTISAEYDPNTLENLRSRTVSSHSDNGRFIDNTTDLTGNTTEYSYDPITGLLLSIYDNENERTTSFQYDGLGRKIRTINPNNTESLTTLHWSDTHTDAPGDAVFYTISQGSGIADILIFTDKYGRKLRTVTYNFDGSKLYVDFDYNPKGLLSSTSLPYKPGEDTHYIVFTYDNYGRKIRTDYPDDRFETTDYSNLDFIYSTSGKGTKVLETKTYYNSLGQVTQVKDNQTKDVFIYYYPDGSPKEYDYGNNYKVTLSYDVNGYRTSITDPDAGTISSTYNAFGELVSQENANDNLTEYIYDKSSRIIEERNYNGLTELDNKKIYYYDLGTNAFFGAITKIEQQNKFDIITNSITYEYDVDGNIIQEYERYLVNSIYKEIYNYFEYDELGRSVSRTYPNGFKVNYTYNQYSDIKSISNNELILWKCEQVNSLGQITQFSMGGNSSNISYDTYGELESKNLSGYKTLTYDFDDLGNLKSREDVSNQLKEVFGYDEMNRLENIAYYENGIYQNGEDLVMEYDTDGFGNITSKSDVGALNYGENIEGSTAGPHAISSVKPLPEYRPDPQSIEYNIFNKITNITNTYDDTYEITYDIEYGLDNQRRRTEYENEYTGEGPIVKYYFGDYEEVLENGETTEYSYISSPTGLCAIHEYSPSDSSSNIWHINTDHLGSPLLLVNATDHSNQIEQSFDAWGNSRDPNDWSLPSSSDLFVDRGFTGHEHLESFSLINMNGRVYDPLLARFLSPDPYVQIPTARSGFNRYSYCLNNPLVYNDPSGNIIAFTDRGYEFWKMWSPIAFKIDIHFSNETRGLGFNMSVGIPKKIPISYRKHWGATYYWQYFDSENNSYKGWEKRKGAEWTFFSFVNISGTEFSMNGDEFSQTTNRMTIGNPAGVNIQYENDYFFEDKLPFKIPFIPAADNGDRWRTAAVKINGRFFDIGLNMFTGDPDENFSIRDRDGDFLDPELYPMHENKRVYYTGTADEYRAGILYLGIGPFRIGRNSEQIRHTFQNRFAHDMIMDVPHFRYDLERTRKWYFYFGFGTGNTIW